MSQGSSRSRKGSEELKKKKGGVGGQEGPLSFLKQMKHRWGNFRGYDNLVGQTSIHHAPLLFLIRGLQTSPLILPTGFSGFIHSSVHSFSPLTHMHGAPPDLNIAI